MSRHVPSARRCVCRRTPSNRAPSRRTAIGPQPTGSPEQVMDRLTDTPISERMKLSIRSKLIGSSLIIIALCALGSLLAIGHLGTVKQSGKDLHDKAYTPTVSSIYVMALSKDLQLQHMTYRRIVAEVVRLAMAQVKTLGGGTGTSLPSRAPRDMVGVNLVQDLFGVRSAQAVDILCYWLALALAVASIVFIYRLLRSRQGLGLAAVRDNAQAARAVGVDALKVKAATYVIVAFITGLASQALVRVEFDGTTAKEAARYPMDHRLRDVVQGPDGALYLLEDGDGGRLLKLVPR